MLEKQIEKKITDYAKAKGYLSFKFNSMSCRAVPDRLFVNPFGLVLFIEFKRLGCKPTIKQNAIINDLLNQGCLVFVINNIEDGKILIDKYAE